MKELKISNTKVCNFLFEKFEELDWKVVEVQHEEFNNYQHSYYHLEFNRDGLIGFLESDYEINTPESYQLNIKLSEDEIIIESSNYSRRFTEADEDCRRYYEILEDGDFIINDKPHSTFYDPFFEKILNIFYEAKFDPREIIEDFNSIEVVGFKQHNGNYNEYFKIYSVSSDTSDFAEELNKFIINNFNKIFNRLERDSEKNDLQLWIVDECNLMTEQEMLNKLKSNFPEYYNRITA